MLNFDEAHWEKKVVKIFKALSMMERYKYLDPHFSKSFSELAQYLFLSYVMHFLIHSNRKANMATALSLSQALANSQCSKRTSQA